MIDKSTEGSKRERNGSDSSWMDITDLDNKELELKSRSNQKVGSKKWSSAKKYRQKLSSTSNETANQNLHENQASNSNDTHERIPHKTQDLNSVQPKIQSNKAGQKFNKQENKRKFLEWKLKRVKGQEDWKKEHWQKAHGNKKEKTVLSSKYLKSKVSNNDLILSIETWGIGNSFQCDERAQSR